MPVHYSFEYTDVVNDVEHVVMITPYVNQEWIWEFCTSRLAYEVELPTPPAPPPTVNPAIGNTRMPVIR